MLLISISWLLTLSFCEKALLRTTRLAWRSRTPLPHPPSILLVTLVFKVFPKAVYKQFMR
ncbi:hypothetical protein GALMADRAFT_579065 [Galerina marginata CBS 339.88]|uniref:Uncharacterized protein n=1 Tax=Galerina marginata (strain CBS 339.88) TaxID=685588 RepID=A0A067T5P7_GALM3|nr:hypothetical protein GALMADRAFT_579065 [Galerina marginata CBS 339.88]